jgi:hypothetical protein
VLQTTSERLPVSCLDRLLVEAAPRKRSEKCSQVGRVRGKGGPERWIEECVRLKQYKRAGVKSDISGICWGQVGGGRSRDEVFENSRQVRGAV